MKTPSLTASDFDSCRGGSASTRPTPFLVSDRNVVSADGTGASAIGIFRAPRGRFLVLAILLGLALSLAGSSSASAAEHVVITGEYGKEGPKASGIGTSCRMAYDSSAGILYLYSDNQIYGLERTGPGSVTPLGAPFPLSASLGKSSSCNDPDLTVNQGSGRIYAVPSTQEIHGWTPAGSPLGAPWPVSTGGETCGVATTNTGEVWGGNYGQLEVTKFTSAGALAGSLSLGYRVCKIEINQQNNDLFVLNYSNGQLKKYTAASGYTTTLSFPSPGSGNRSLAVNGNENRLYVARNSGSDVKAYDTNTAELVEEITVGGTAREVVVDEETDTLFVQVNSGSSGYIAEYLGVKVPKATTGPSVGNDGVTGTADPNEAGAGEINECYFEYGETTAYGSTQECNEGLPITTEQEVTATLPGLTGETTYHYRLVLGTGEPGIVGRGADETITPHYVEALETQPASGITRTTAILNASFEGNGEATSFYFDWGATSAYGEQTASPPGEGVGSPVGPSTYEFELTGLTAGTDYHFRVVGTNPLGVSAAQDVEFTTSPAIKQLITTPATNLDTTKATLNGEIDPDGLETTFYFEYGRTTAYGQTKPVPPGEPVGTTAPGLTPVSAELDNLRPNVEYHYRIVGTNATGTTIASDDQAFTTPQPPSIESFHSRNVTKDSAELVARINPNGEETSYYFEYGVTPGYGTVVPIPDGELPAGTAAEEVAVPIGNLQPQTYHFRVTASSKWGTRTTGDQTFSFYPPDCPNEHVRQQTGATYLPDCRAYELVSPENAGNVVFLAGAPISAYASNPSRFSFGAVLGTVEEPGTGEAAGTEQDKYIATRASTGWKTKYVGLHATEALVFGSRPQASPGSPAGGGPFGSLSLDKYLDWSHGEGVALCCGSKGSFAPYLWDAEGNSLGRLPTNLGEVPGAADDLSVGGFIGDGLPSPDFSHYFFSSRNMAFAEGGLTAAPGSAYDNDLETETVEIASIAPEGGDIPPGVGGESEFIEFQGASDDGSHVLMSTKGGGSNRHLYMRVDNLVTYDVSLGADAQNHAVALEDMTADGEKVYFTSTEQLTTDDHDTSRDLFLWDEGAGAPTISRISKGPGSLGDVDSCSASWTSKCGAILPTIPSSFGLGTSTALDGAVARNAGDVYFYSPELLDDEQGILGQRNLYLYRGGTVRYVATFTGSSLLDRLQVSPDGAHMAFITAEQLTAYDNTSESGSCTPKVPKFSPNTGPRCKEMYTYDPGTDTIRCVSCIPDGTPPTTDVAGSLNGLFMTDDGRTFFATEDALENQDANQGLDTYEFVENRPQLISSGTADVTGNLQGLLPTGLIGVSADGTDAYFMTLDSLVGQDRNGPFPKFYDARTGGGFEFVPPPAPCEAADECHGPSTQAPALPTAGTAAALGASGNLHPKKKSKRKKSKRAKKKRHRRNRKRHRRNRKRHKRTHGKAAKAKAVGRGRANRGVRKSR